MSMSDWWVYMINGTTVQFSQFQYDQTVSAAQTQGTTIIKCQCFEIHLL